MKFRMIDLDEKDIKQLLKSYLLKSYFVFCSVVGIVLLLGLFITLYYGQNEKVSFLQHCLKYLLFPYFFIILLPGILQVWQYRKLFSLYSGTITEISNGQIAIRTGNTSEIFRTEQVEAIQTFEMFQLKSESGISERYDVIFLIKKRKFLVFSNSVLVRIEPRETTEQFIDKLRMYVPKKVKRNMW